MIPDKELRKMLTHERMRKADTIRLTMELRKMYKLNKSLIYKLDDVKVMAKTIDILRKKLERKERNER